MNKRGGLKVTAPTVNGDERGLPEPAAITNRKIVNKLQRFQTSKTAKRKKRARRLRFGQKRLNPRTAQV